MRTIFKWKLKFFFFLMLSMFVFSNVAYAAETQTLTIDPATGSKAVAESLALTVNYTVTNDAATAGIAAVVHFNSSKVTFVDFSDVDKDSANGTIFNQIDVPQDDTTDLDNDTTTDKYVSLIWSNFSNTFSGTSRSLGVFNFTVNENAYNGSAQFNITTGNPAFGLTRETEGATITVTGGKAAPSAPVLAPATGYYKAAVSVTATVDEGVTTYYTLDGTAPDATDTEYTGAAVNVDDNDTVAVTVTMKSYDAVGDIWGDAGSAVYTFDKADPVAVISVPSADAFVKAAALTIKGTASDVTSGVAKVEVSIDGQTNWADATLTNENWTFDATLAKGANAIAVRVTDNAGNAVVVTGNTITYYPPLALTVEGADVTGQKINVPNTAGSNTKTITVSGGSGNFATYTWATDPADTTFGALSAATGESVIYTAVAGQKGTHTVTVTDPADGIFTASMTVEVVDFSVSADKEAGYVGSTVVFTAVGNTGTVEWEVVGDGGDVTGTPVISGEGDTIATITPVAAGTFQLKATDGGTGGTGVAFTTPAFTIHSVPDFSGLPESTETIVYDPTKPVEYTVSGGDETYEWTVTNPANVTSAPVTGASFTFTAPNTGNFAGNYTVKVAESTAYESSFTVYVPLKIQPDQTRFILPASAAPIAFTVTGAADGLALTATIDSLDDETDNVEIPKVFSGNAAAFGFTPADYTVDTTTGQKDFTIDVAVENHTDLPQIELTLVPVASVGGVITDTPAEGATAAPISGAMVTITSPLSYAGTTAVTDATGVFSFTGLPAADPTGKAIEYGFEAKAGGYIAKTFKSTELAEDGTTEIALASSAASLSGTVSVGAINPQNGTVGVCNVSLVDDSGTVTGPIETDTNGNFRFEFETAPATPVAYTVKAAKVGYKGEAPINVTAFPFTGADVVMAAITDPGDYTGTGTVLGFVDAAQGADITVTAPPADFGTNGTVKLELLPADAGGTATVVNPVTAAAADLTDANAPESGVEWEIEGLSGGCAIVPVPFDIAQADDVASGALVVWYNHESAPGTWDGWKVAETVDVDYITDDPKIGIIYVKICNWSANIVGLAAAPAGSGGGGGGGGCFINSVSSGGNSGGMAALALLFASAAALAAIGRRRNQ